MNATKDGKITQSQLNRIRTLIEEKDLTDLQCEILACFVGKEITCAEDELTREEAVKLIRTLQYKEIQEWAFNQRSRTRIFFIAWNTGMIYGSSTDDKKMNIAKINMFFREKGTVKKNMFDYDARFLMNKSEIKKSLRQFESLYKKHLKNK
jgi:hypothetical protein